MNHTEPTLAPPMPPSTIDFGAILAAHAEREARTLTLSTGRIIPTRWVGEQHVKEDLGFIPSFADWVKAIRPEPWMCRTERIEAQVDPHLASPVVGVS